MLDDRYGLPLSTESLAARDFYIEGVDLLLAANYGSEAAFRNAIAADADFALAHAALARTLQLHAQAAPAKQAAARARELLPALPDRERRNAEMLAMLVDGQGPPPLAFAKQHLAEFPRDAMVLAPCTGVFGLIGFSGRKGREAEQIELLDAYAGHYGEDWWFLSSHAFGLVEIGRLDEARRAIERSLQLHPRNAHGAHVNAHVLYECGEDAAGLAYLQRWMPEYPRAAQLHCHLSWHVALWHLEAGNLDAARRVYAEDVRPGGSWGPPINTVSDSASFLWRLELAGGARDAALWGEVRDLARKEFPRAGITFIDVHSALAYAASGDRAALDELIAQLRERERNGKLAAGPIVPVLAEAFGACVGGNWREAVRLIEPLLGEHERIGGSRAQRDLIEYTLLMGLLQTGRREEAQTLLERRRGRSPAAPVAGSTAFA